MDTISTWLNPLFEGTDCRERFPRELRAIDLCPGIVDAAYLCLCMFIYHIVEKLNEQITSYMSRKTVILISDGQFANKRYDKHPLK